MLQSLPLYIKVAKSKQRIREWITYHGRENIYISFSGGKDSTVLTNLVREVEIEMFGDIRIPLVFSDTGLEYPELKTFVNTFENVVTIRPKMTFVEVIKKYGYPIVSKAISSNIHKLKYQNLTDKFRNYLLNGDERGKYGMVPKKWQILLDADFDVNNACCKVMKIKPFKIYERKTGRYASFVGTLADDSSDRQRIYLQFGCNAYSRKSGAKSTPLGFWTKNDILQYIYENNIEICSVYGDVVLTGYKEINNIAHPQFKTTKVQHTGCIFCGYGIQFAPKGELNRIQQLAYSHPAIYKYCVSGGCYDERKKWIPHKGLGLGHVLDFIGIEWRVDGKAA